MSAAPGRLPRPPLTVVLAAPRGFCAGVERAIATVETTLDLVDAPVYVRKEIVHNAHVVSEQRARGAVFVDELDEVPPGATVVFSAHGVPPEAFEQARERDLTVIDATCPLVNKVHVEARRLAEDGYHILLVGHADHDEVVGTFGEAPTATTVVEDLEHASRVELDVHPKLACISQTTLSVDDVDAIVAELQRRRPDVRNIAERDLCYATQNRQMAVRAIAGLVRILIVVGSANSSNSRQLVKVAESAGTAARLVENASALDASWFADHDVVGLTSGASAPAVLVDEVLDWFGDRWALTTEEVTVAEESITFRPPRQLQGLRTE